ncbi:MAG: hypothetical protein AABY22_02110 [Nanoarchaeota archaeon]
MRRYKPTGTRQKIYTCDGRDNSRISVIAFNLKDAKRVVKKKWGKDPILSTCKLNHMQTKSYFKTRIIKW